MAAGGEIMSNHYYPALLDMRKFPALVIGGGSVAFRKVEMLLEFGTCVKVVSLEAIPQIKALAEQELIALAIKPYDEEDLEGFRLTVVATNDRNVNEKAYRDADARGMLVNVVDQPELCNFIVPAMVIRDSLLIAISTGGKSPAMAKWLRQRLEREYGPEYGPFLEFLGELREQYLERIPVEAVRSRAFMDVIESEAFHTLKSGQTDEARATAIRILESHAKGDTE